MQPIDRRKFPEIIAEPCGKLYANLSCGFRRVVKIMSILRECFNRDFECVPHRNTIENWIEKTGYSVYKEPVTDVTKGKYAMIADESMMFGGQKMPMTPGVKSEKREGSALCHGETDILKPSVKSSRSGEEIKKNVEEKTEEIGHAPEYVASDNANGIVKGIRETECAMSSS